MAIREGRWRCPYCSVVNRGAHLACLGCGAQRDKDVAFFLEDDAVEVQDQALLAVARAGADWLCEFCQTSNRPDATSCVQCGAEKGASPSRPVRELADVPAPVVPAVAAPRGSGKGCLWLLAALLLLGLGLAGIVGYFSLRKTTETVKVAGFEWQRTIRLQALRTVREKAWEGELPSGARVVSRSREVHHNEQEQTGTRRVKVGRRDLGNGFFEDVYEDQPVYRDRPIYRNRLTYDVERWIDLPSLETRGGDRRPRWPEAAVGRNEREAGRDARYVVKLQGATKIYELELAEDRFAQFDADRTYQALIQGGHKVLELK